MKTIPEEFKEVFRDAANLPEYDRATLAGLLIESLESEPDPDVEATGLRKSNSALPNWRAAP